MKPKQWRKIRREAFVAGFLDGLEKTAIVVLAGLMFVCFAHALYILAGYL